MTLDISAWLAPALLAVTVSCSGSDGPTSQLDRTAALASVLDVRASGCGPTESFGTAALVADDRAVTAAHVVAGADQVRVIDADGQDHDVDVVFFDPEFDLAVLATPDGLGAPLAIADAEAEAGDSGVVGFARLVDGTVTTRIVDVEVLRHVNIATTDIYREADVTRPGFEVDATIDPGDSGGVVVIGGEATGIIWARSSARDARAWAVDLAAPIGDGERLASWNAPVDTGRCTR